MSDRLKGNAPITAEQKIAALAAVWTHISPDRLAALDSLREEPFWLDRLFDLFVVGDTVLVSDEQYSDYSDEEIDCIWHDYTADLGGGRMLVVRTAAKAEYVNGERKLRLSLAKSADVAHKFAWIFNADEKCDEEAFSEKYLDIIDEYGF